MKKLTELGIAENTLLIVSSDNGGTPVSDDGKDGSWLYELYDLSKDPYEKQDLAGRMPEKTRELSALLEEKIRM